MADELPPDMGVYIFVSDNWYTSLEAVRYVVKEKKFHFVGTARANRPTCLFAGFLHEALGLKRKKKGESKQNEREEIEEETEKEGEQSETIEEETEKESDRSETIEIEDADIPQIVASIVNSDVEISSLERSSEEENDQLAALMSSSPSVTTSSTSEQSSVVIPPESNTPSNTAPATPSTSLPNLSSLPAPEIVPPSDILPAELQDKVTVYRLLPGQLSTAVTCRRPQIPRV